jgi:hypothetical protein
MVLLDAALHLVYESSYRCRHAHRRLARRGSPRSWSPHGADRAALPSASQVSKHVDVRVLSTRSVHTMMGIVEVDALATSQALRFRVGFASARSSCHRAKKPLRLKAAAGVSCHAATSCELARNRSGERPSYRPIRHRAVHGQAQGRATTAAALSPLCDRSGGDSVRRRGASGRARARRLDAGR